MGRVPSGSGPFQYSGLRLLFSNSYRLSAAGTRWRGSLVAGVLDRRSRSRIYPLLATPTPRTRKGSIGLPWFRRSTRRQAACIWAVAPTSFWRAWIGRLATDSAGCFRLQVDGDVFTEFIVVEVNAGNPPPSLAP